LLLSMAASRVVSWRLSCSWLREPKVKSMASTESPGCAVSDGHPKGVSTKPLHGYPSMPVLGLQLCPDPFAFSCLFVRYLFLMPHPRVFVQVLLCERKYDTCAPKCPEGWPRARIYGTVQSKLFRKLSTRTCFQPQTITNHYDFWIFGYGSK